MRTRSILLAMLLLVSACDSLPSWLGGAEKEIKRLPGERQDVLKISVDLKPDEILQQVSFKLPDAVENVAWAQHTGQFTALNANLAIKGELKESQTTSAGEGNDFSHSVLPRPVAADGRVFAMDGQGAISAHDVKELGNRFWNSDVLLADDAVAGGGLAVDTGKLYAVSGLGKIASLDAATGTVLWQKNLGVPLRSAPCVASGKVFVVTIDSQLYALDAATGDVVWTHRGIGETAALMNNVTPVVAADMVLAPYASGELYALKIDSGDEVWRSSLVQSKRTDAIAIFSGISGDPVVDESVVFAVSNSGVFSVFSLLNGQPLWQKNIASNNTPWVVGEYVFVLTSDNILVAMVKYDGRVRWTLPLQSYKDEKRKLSPVAWRGPIVENGRVLVISSDGQMVQVDGANGAILSTIDIADDIETAPMASNGALFMLDKSATLHRFQ